MVSARPMLRRRPEITCEMRQKYTVLMPNPVGECHICGKVGPLTYEHIPPQAAFNDVPVVVADFLTLIKRQAFPGDPIKGKKLQRGMGYYSLCDSCNTTTGNLYAPRLIDWTHQGLSHAIQLQSGNTLHLPFHIFPLHIIKQVVAMFLSVNRLEMVSAHSELREFVLNRGLTGLSSRYRIFTFYSLSSTTRIAPFVMQNGTPQGRTFFSEIALPPFGYVLSVDSAPPDYRLCEITSFADMKFNEYADMFLNIPFLSGSSFLPGHYESLEELQKLHPKPTDEK